MKNGFGLLVCALALLAFASTAQSDQGQNGGGEASGNFTFDLGTAAGTTSLFGQLRNDGTVNGQISFNAEIDVSGEVCQQDVCEPTGETDDSCDACEQSVQVSMFRETVGLNFLIDRMVLDGNRACMSGTINDESPFNGLHTILAVENASGNDGFTWGIYKTKTVNTNAKDYEFCYRGYSPPDDCGELNNCPVPSPGCVAFEGPPPPDDPGAGLTYVASDYELCPYPPPSDNPPYNFVPEDPNNHPCYTGNPDPHGGPAGIPVLATLTITHCESFPLFSYPMTPIPHGGGNKLNVKQNS